MGFSAEDIQVLTGLEAVRKRPRMYIDDSKKPGTLTCLVVEALCLAADQLEAATATRAAVTLHSDGAIGVEDDGPGLPVDETPAGMRVAEVIVSALTACRLVKVHTRVGERFCTNGIVVTNALSAFFELSVERAGEAWFQRYEQGNALAPLTRVGTTAGHGTRIRFRPDPVFFGTTRLDAADLAERIREAGPVAAKIALVDLRAGE